MKQIIPASIFNAVFCIVLTGSAIILTSCEQQDRTIDDMAKPVQVVTVKETDNTITRVLSGTVQAAQSADLSFEVGGVVSEIMVEPGEYVSKGQKLARLRETTYALNVQQSEGRQAEIKARLSQAKKDYERRKRLFEAGAVSERQFQATKTEYQALRDQLKSAKAQLGIAQENLGDTVLKAPYDGQISARYMDASQQVQAGTAVLRIQNQDRMEVATSIPESFIARVDIGSRHRVRFPVSEGLTVDATLTEMANAANNAGAFPAVLQLAKTVDILHPGMTAEVVLVLPAQYDGHENNETRETFAVPFSALVAGEGQKYSVFKLSTEENSVQQQSVNVVDIGKDTVRITSGVQAGDKVVSRGASFLRDGQKVRRIDGNQPNVYQE